MTKEKNENQEIITMLQKMSKSITKLETKLNKLTAKTKQNITDNSGRPMVAPTNLNKQTYEKNIANSVGVGVPDGPFHEGNTTANVGASIARPFSKGNLNTEKPKIIISEITKNVYLPYTEEDIEYYKQCGYETEVEIAKRFFTIPLKQYENFAKSRVRERIQVNEKQRKSRNNRIHTICTNTKKRNKTAPSNNNSLQNTR